MFYQNSSLSSSKLPSQIGYSSRRSQARQFRSIYTSINQTDFSKTRKVYNMEDPCQERIKRSKHFLYEPSNKQVTLFEKGVKKIDLSKLSKQNVQNCSLESGKLTRRYKNKSTIQLFKDQPQLHESSALLSQQGGKKKVIAKAYQARAGKCSMVASHNQTVNVFDHSREKSELSQVSQNRKKIFLNKLNKQEDQQKQNYIVKVIPKKQNGSQLVSRKQIYLNFSKKSNKLNERNLKQTERLVQNSKKHFNQTTRKQNLINNQFGIGTIQSKKAIDFKQDYYNNQRNQRIPTWKSCTKLWTKTGRMH